MLIIGLEILSVVIGFLNGTTGALWCSRRNNSIWGKLALTRSQVDEAGLSGLGHSAAKNAALTLSGQAGRFLLQLVSVVVLSRLLTETDYGLVGMVWAIIGIGHILKDVGLGSAAIQARRLSSGQRTNLFWLNTAAGLVLAGMAVSFAPLIAAFYGRDDLVPLVWGLAPTLVLSGMATQYRSDLTRHLRLGRVALADILSTVLGLGAGVVGAIMGLGPNALVAQQLVGGVAALLLFSVFAGWMPGLYRRSEPMRELFNFGLPMFGAQMLTYVVNNADSILIGRLFGPIPVGLYSRGLQIVRVPMNQLRGPLDTLSLSVLSRLHDDDVRFMQFVQRGQLVMIYPLLAAAGGLVASAPALVDLALGPRWADTAVFIQFLALGEGMTSVAAVGGWIYASRGLATQLMKFTAFTAIVRIVLMLGGSVFGPAGVAGGFALGHLLLWPVSLWWIGRLSKLDTVPLMFSALRVIAVCAVPSLLTWGAVSIFAGLPSVFLVPLAVAVHCAGFLCLAAVRPVRRDYGEILRTVRMARNKR